MVLVTIDESPTVELVELLMDALLALVIVEVAADVSRVRVIAEQEANDVVR